MLIRNCFGMTRRKFVKLLATVSAGAAMPVALVRASESLLAHDMVSLAWLLESRRTVAEDQKTGRSDPYSSQFLVNVANQWVSAS